MTSEELKKQAESNLKSLVERNKLYVDTCSLLHFSAIDFLDNIECMLREKRKKLYILSGAIKEMEKHSLNPENQELSSNAKRTLRITNQLIRDGLANVVNSDGFVDNDFLARFTSERMEESLLLITQDKNLAKDILALNDNKSVKANKVKVKRINKYGFLSDFRNTEADNDNKGLLDVPGDGFLPVDVLDISNLDLSALNDEEYESVCHLYVSGRLYNEILSYKVFDFPLMKRLICCSCGWDELKTKDGRRLQLEVLYQLVKQASNISIDKTLLFEVVKNLATAARIDVIEQGPKEKEYLITYKIEENLLGAYNVFNYCRYSIGEYLYEEEIVDSAGRCNYPTICKINYPFFSEEQDVLLEKLKNKTERDILAERLYFRYVKENIDADKEGIKKAFDLVARNMGYEN